MYTDPRDDDYSTEDAARDTDCSEEEARGAWDAAEEDYNRDWRLTSSCRGEDLVLVAETNPPPSVL